MNKRPAMSVVLSFYNEEEVIPELISRLRKVFRVILDTGKISSYELIFVNDASTDASLELLRKIGKEQGDIKILNMSRNFGVSPCVLAGFEHAKGDLVVYMDADLQDPPETIPLMLEKYLSEGNVDVVHTVRRSRAGETRLKLLITRLGYWILKRVSTVNLQIEAGDFKLLSRRAVNQLIQFQEKRPFMRGLVSWIGFRQTIVYYHREARFAGETKFLVLGWKVITNFLSSALISFSDIPLQFSSWFGGILSLLSLLYSAFLVIRYACGGMVSEWSITLCILSFISGIQLFSIGMIGLYIAAIHIESKKRPNYILESVVEH